MDCHRVEELAFLFADDEMEETLRFEFRQHLDGCPDCHRRARVVRQVLTIVRTSRFRRPAPERLRRRILTSLPHRKGVL